MNLDIYQFSGLAITALVATIGIIKFKLIEEVVKKMTPSDQNAKSLSVLFLIALIVVLMMLSLIIPQPSIVNDKEVTVNASEQPTTPQIEKTEFDKGVEVTRETIELTTKLVEQAKEKKKIKDSIFQATREERWVYGIGDWTKDENKILELNQKLSHFRPFKLFKKEKRYLFIKEEGNSTKEELEASRHALQDEVGLRVEVIDLNSFLKKEKQTIVDEPESFGKRAKRIRLDCLAVD